MGTNAAMSVLKKHIAVKPENESYAMMKDAADIIEIIHDAESTNLSLSKGRLVSKHQEFGFDTTNVSHSLYHNAPYPAWVIKVSAGVKFKRMYLKVFGLRVELGATGKDCVFHPPGFNVVGTDEIVRLMGFETDGIVYHRFEPYAC
jgi:hypothetical protein